MSRHRRWLAAACGAIVAGAAVVGCAPAAPPSVDVVRVAIGGAPDSLDPRFASGAIGVRLSQLLAPPLCVIDDALRPSLRGATAITVSDDGRIVDISLREGQAGVSADDVVFTYRSILDPATRSPHRARL